MDGGKSNYYGASFMVRAYPERGRVGDAGQDNDKVTTEWRGREAKTFD
jgi:hypothetical protein